MKGFGLCALDYPTLERLYLPLSICFYASLYYGPLFFPSLFLCSLSVVSLLCILTVILNGLIEILHQVDWILFAQRLQSIWTIALLLLFVTDRIKPDHALGRPSVVSPASESNSLQNTHIQNFYGSHDESSLICCAHAFPPPPTLCSPSTQRSVRRRRLPFAVFPVQLCPLSFFFLASYASVVQAVHTPSSASTFSPRSSCCTTIHFFALSLPHYLGCCFTCYRCICSLPYPLL